jgi:hypothetical protein
LLLVYQRSWSRAGYEMTSRFISITKVRFHSREGDVRALAG